MQFGVYQLQVDKTTLLKVPFEELLGTVAGRGNPLVTVVAFRYNAVAPAL